MTIDLTQFHAAFYEESFEALGSMEQTLLQLDGGMPDAESINTLFRVAHSIKGGAATFGFAAISSLTHSLESLLDQLRAQQLAFNASLSELLLRSVDALRGMLRAQQGGAPADPQRIADLQFDIELMVAGTAPAPSAAASVAPTPAARLAATAPCLPQHRPGTGERAWHIEFRPFAQLLERGNDPLRMFRELRALGELQVQSEIGALPGWAAYEPEHCYLAWTLRLRTSATPEAIREVFDWAEGDCTLELHELIEQALGPPGVSSSASADTPIAAAPAAAPAVAAAAGESVPEPPAAGVTATRTVDPAGGRLGETGSLRVSVEKIDELMNSVSELVITHSMLGQLVAGLEGAAAERLRAGMTQLERNVRDLQESVMRVRMVPISFVFSRFPRMVRDLSQRLGKQVELKISGADTELDKTVLEKIGDPLVHLVRNCLDHGIEPPEQRRAAGKPERGTLRLHAYHHASSISVEVSDDGAGLQRDRILEKARSRGLVAPEEPLSDTAIHELIFLPGFSTVEQTTDVSGRGVGMDVVKRNVESLGGGIEVRSTPGRGATFVITLPLTLAIIDGQTVAVGEDSYIVPLTSIVESLQRSAAAVRTVVGHGEVLAFRGEFLPLLRLDAVLRAPRVKRPQERDGLIMVVEAEGRRVGLLVDELLGQQQVVVKTLATNYGVVPGIAGATILGNGSVALILDIGALTRWDSERLVA